MGEHVKNLQLPFGVQDYMPQECYNKNLTQEKLAEMSDIDYKYLQKLESKNPSSPSLSVLEKLSHGLGITLTEFVTFIEEGRKKL